MNGIDIHPALLDRVYHWAEDTAGAGNVKCEQISDSSVMVKQDDREAILSLEDIPPDLGPAVFGYKEETFGPLWPD